MFNRRIETIKEIHDKVSAKNPLREYPKTVQAFLDVINSKENLVYTDTYEVKHESREYIFDVKNIRQLIDNGIVYPDNTRVELILVPSDTRELSKDDELYEKITAFDTLMDSYLSLPEDRQREIMNVLVHDNGSLRRDTNKVLLKLIREPIHTSYADNISDKRFNCMHQNFRKLQIRIITMKELESVRIDTDYIMKVLFPFDE